MSLGTPLLQKAIKGVCFFRRLFSVLAVEQTQNDKGLVIDTVTIC